MNETTEPQADAEASGSRHDALIMQMKRTDKKLLSEVCATGGGGRGIDTMDSLAAWQRLIKWGLVCEKPGRNKCENQRTHMIHTKKGQEVNRLLFP